MGSLSFSKIASAILASVATGGVLHTTAVSGTFQSSTASSSASLFPGENRDSSSLSNVCLKGKLDLSMWRNIGNDDDDDEEDEDEEIQLACGDLKEKNQRDEDRESRSPLPPPSPILAPLLGTKSRGEKEVVPVIKRMLSPAPLFLPLPQAAANNNNSLGVPSPAVVVLGGTGAVHQRKSHHYNNDFVGRVPSSSTSPPILLVSVESSSSPSSHFQNHYGNKAIELGGAVTPTCTLCLSSSGGVDDGGSARHDLQKESQQRTGNSIGVGGQSSLLRQQNQQLLTTAGVAARSSIISQQAEKPQELVQVVEVLEPKRQAGQPLLPLLSSFIGSTQLSRDSQYQNSGSRERVIRSGKKVEFTPEQIMEQQQAATMAAAEQGGQGAEKMKRTESAKDGSSVATRSRSGSAIRRPSSRVPTDILQEIRKMSLASQDALEEKKKAAAGAGAGSAPSSGRKLGKKAKYKRRKPEEVFTDKDRAAAVTLGSKDIKQSLKAKKKRDRKMRLSISFLSGEDYVINALLGEASYQMRVKKQPEAALHTLNKALEIQPNHKGALVARSQCYLKLGDAEAALKDAELTWDPNNQNDRYIQGLFQYAEALYQLGEFEKALIAFHRGHRIRKDQDGFRIGIQKCQEAIKRAIGDKKATSIPNLDTVLPLIKEFDETKSRMTPEERLSRNDEQVLKNLVKYKNEFVVSSAADMKVKSKLITRELMGQLYLDKSYLKKFINRPEVINQQGLAKGLRDEACEALNYLESRERFWRQQNPLYSRKNFTTMLKAHAHDAACREQSVSVEPSIAKYLQRRASVLPASSPPPIGLGQAQLSKRRSSSEVQLATEERTQIRKSVERNNSEEQNKTQTVGDRGRNESQVRTLKKTMSTDSVRSKSNQRT